jgi:hypothetical protein
VKTWEKSQSVHKYKLTQISGEEGLIAIIKPG